ncbi:DNA-formamidopyrimidine glycosylase family protein [Pedobacter frigiditerrae]|uniref:DNA-formamidopyrimidine glycosylase family protein n=1 Tax=Pedobacter frigiditerrae TaxID=2530452 RepID=UPI0029304B2D|nr:DNA-formamidopyrimidine glycosylase family protein [Pedobacter frigiditerrae]
MPEGPSIVILRELIEDLKLEGTKVLKVIGTTELDKKRMEGQKVLAFKTWGKHFLICFKGFALRIHLMMFGTYRINEHKKVKPKISFIFKDNEINFYTCSLQFIEDDLDNVYDWSADIMSKKWDVKKTVKRLADHNDDLVCDVLLNQQLFSGSGNIIKNEVLYQIGVQPKSKIKDLPLIKLKALATHAKSYAFDFLKWKKEYTLSKHWEVYSQKICPQKHPIKKEDIGKNKRISYYCETCQKLY